MGGEEGGGGEGIGDCGCSLSGTTSPSLSSTWKGWGGGEEVKLLPIAGGAEYRGSKN